MQVAVAGFRNEGNTCGACAALALLLSSPPVLDIVVKQRGAEGSVLRALHNIAVDAWQFGVGAEKRGDHVVETTRTLRERVGPPDDRRRFISERQFNSLQFTQAVLERVPELRKLFELEAATVTTCVCGFESRCPEAATSLFLAASSVSNPVVFADQLEASLCKSRPAVVREARCGGCLREGEMASGRFEVAAAGEVLLLSVVSGGDDAVSSPLDPPLDIRVGGRSFKLRSVVVHHSMPSRHFTARSVATDDTCREHNDAVVTLTGSVGGADAYMCLYERTDEARKSRHVMTDLGILHGHRAASASPARGSGQRTGRLAQQGTNCGGSDPVTPPATSRSRNSRVPAKYRNGLDQKKPLAPAPPPTATWAATSAASKDQQFADETVDFTPKEL